MAQLKLALECDKETCFNKSSKKFCQFFGAVHFGQTAVCRLFPSDDRSYTKLRNSQDDGLGYSLRCEQCLKAAE